MKSEIICPYILLNLYFIKKCLKKTVCLNEFQSFFIRVSVSEKDGKAWRISYNRNFLEPVQPTMKLAEKPFV
jgi:hypothetical protein